MSRDAATGFGDVAARYAALRPKYPPALFEFLLRRLSGARQFAVDLGAGPAKASLDLTAYFERVAAVEPDPRMFAAAPDHPRIERIACAAEDAEFPPGDVDCVIAATSFHWMDQERVCARVAEWLRPGGVFFPFLYGPFAVAGAAEEPFRRHWALWTPHRDKRLGAKADYAPAMRACGAFAELHTYSDSIEVALGAKDAAGLLLTASYARAYMTASGAGDCYFDQLAEDLAPHAPVTIGFPLGGVLGVRA